MRQGWERPDANAEGVVEGRERRLHSSGTGRPFSIAYLRSSSCSRSTCALSESIVICRDVFSAFSIEPYYLFNKMYDTGRRMSFRVWPPSLPASL